MRALCPVLSILVVATFGVTTSQGQDLLAESTADVLALNQRMDQYESRLAVAEAGAIKAKTFCYACASRPGTTLGAQFLLLKPFQSEGETPGYNFKSSFRVWLGWTRDDGLGFRVRWFDYNDHHPGNSGFAAGLIESIDITVVDLEVTDKFQLAHWYGLLSGGLRYANYEEFGFTDADEMYDSLGMVLGVELNRPLGHCWSIVSLARGSIQFAGEGLLNDNPMSNLTFHIFETQLGVRRVWHRSKERDWFIQSAFESQYWSGGVIGDGDSEDLGLIGFTFGFGTTR